MAGGLLSVLFNAGLIADGNRDGAAGEGAPMVMVPQTLPKLHLNGVRMAHFSNTTGKAICKVSAAKILPASKRAGPFILPSPGYEMRQVAIDIISENCAEEDWDALASFLTELRRFTLREAITVRLLDESGNNTGALWRVTGAPSLRSSPAGQSGGVLLFSSLDKANRRVPLLLFRDSSSGALVLRSPPSRPGYPGAAQ